MSLLHRVGVFAGALFTSLLFTSPSHAQCTVNGNYNKGSHFLVNGRWNESYPEVTFKVPGASVGNGVAVSPDSTINAAASNDYVRFRLRVLNRSKSDVDMYMDSSIPLSCVSCASSVTFPFSKISWTQGLGSTGTTPGNGQFNSGVQNLISAAKGTDNVFNLHFNFANDTVLPAGVYTGEFQTRGIPQ